MDPKSLFFDSRHIVNCAYCGGEIENRDHVPSKTLLEKPYPNQLPVVGSCIACNEGFSLDEEYVGCFLECTLCGTTDPALIKNSRVSRALKRNTSLRCRIEKSKTYDLFGNLLWHPELHRFKNVVIKLAKGHVAYDFWPKTENPDVVQIAPLSRMTQEQISLFEDESTNCLATYPEIGTRAFFRLFGKTGDSFLSASGWNEVQVGNYRYRIDDGEPLVVRIVLREYLTCTVIWD